MSWLRRNRWWLAVLPVAVVALVGATSYNAKVFWYDSGLHHAMATAKPGEFVTVTDDYSDPYGDTSRTLKVRLVDVGTSTIYPTVDGYDTPPDGLVAVQVHLEFEADPGQTLNYCSLLVEDEQGRRYPVPDQSVQNTPCLPTDRTGPVYPTTKDVPRGFVPEGEHRPPTWDKWTVVLMPEDAKVARVLLWWDFPDYVALPAP